MVNNISEDERRKLKRIASLHLVSYKILDNNGNVMWEGMARTLDINSEGIKLELSHKPSQLGEINIELGLGENIIKAKGKIIYIIPANQDLFHLGIKFTHLEGNDIENTIDNFFNNP